MAAKNVRRGFQRFGVIVAVPFLLVALGMAGLAVLSTISPPRSVSVYMGSTNPDGSYRNPYEDRFPGEKEYEQKVRSDRSEQWGWAAVAFGAGVLAFAAIASFGWAVSGFFRD